VLNPFYLFLTLSKNIRMVPHAFISVIPQEISSRTKTPRGRTRVVHVFPWSKALFRSAPCAKIKALGEVFRTQTHTHGGGICSFHVLAHQRFKDYLFSWALWSTYTCSKQSIWYSHPELLVPIAPPRAKQLLAEDFHFFIIFSFLFLWRQKSIFFLLNPGYKACSLPSLLYRIEAFVWKHQSIETSQCFSLAISLEIESEVLETTTQPGAAPQIVSNSRAWL
jgi:hypothetical protein